MSTMWINRNRNTPIPASRCRIQDQWPGPPRYVKYSRGLTMRVRFSLLCTRHWMDADAKCRAPLRNLPPHLPANYRPTAHRTATLPFGTMQSSEGGREAGSSQMRKEPAQRIRECSNSKTPNDATTPLLCFLTPSLGCVKIARELLHGKEPRSSSYSGPRFVFPDPPAPSHERCRPARGLVVVQAGRLSRHLHHD